MPTINIYNKSGAQVAIASLNGLILKRNALYNGFFTNAVIDGGYSRIKPLAARRLYYIYHNRRSL